MPSSTLPYLSLLCGIKIFTEETARMQLVWTLLWMALFLLKDPAISGLGTGMAFRLTLGVSDYQSTGQAPLKNLMLGLGDERIM